MTKPAQPLDTYIACPTCDALHPTDGVSKLVCVRCHTVLVAPERRAGLKLLAMALASAGLIYGAVTLPFLTIKRFWMSNDATLIETALAFEGPLLLLSVAVLFLILVLPALRLGLTLYVLTPVVLGTRPLPHASAAFGWSERLRPWSMAEIFVVGCAVALVKIVAMAEVTFGPAFYMFAAATVLIWAQDSMMCRLSLWRALER
ncbi:MAG: paraquat-inducible protein A [Silicimonas sp.]|jgi:paraquat-inducible protein A|nr:paraquat-inducible protein A [Silicimonas sp.]